MEIEKKYQLTKEIPVFLDKSRIEKDSILAQKNDGVYK